MSTDLKHRRGPCWSGSAWGWGDKCTQGPGLALSGPAGLIDPPSGHFIGP